MEPLKYSDIHYELSTDGIIEIWGLPEYSSTYEIILIIDPKQL